MASRFVLTHSCWSRYWLALHQPFPVAPAGSTLMVERCLTGWCVLGTRSEGQRLCFVPAESARAPHTPRACKHQGLGLDAKAMTRHPCGLLLRICSSINPNKCNLERNIQLLTITGLRNLHIHNMRCEHKATNSATSRGAILQPDLIAHKPPCACCVR